MRQVFFKYGPKNHLQNLKNAIRNFVFLQFHKNVARYLYATWFKNYFKLCKEYATEGALTSSSLFNWYQ